MTLAQSHDTPPGHKQSLCEVRSSDVFLYERYGPHTNFALTDEWGGGGGIK